MRIFAIGDLHLSGQPPKKPMDIFGAHWQNHWEKIKEDWLAKVTDTDIVCIVGDTSWALRLDEALEDLQTISALPGQKILIRGNHDYWWTSVKKMNTAIPEAFTFLQGHGLTVNHIAFGGTRGYICPGDTQFKPEQDTSIYRRELLRTEAALQEMSLSESDYKILLLHYPPFSDTKCDEEFAQLLAKYKVDHCIFGHLHDQTSFQRIPSHLGGTKLHLVSADYLQFTIKEIPLI